MDRLDDNSIFAYLSSNEAEGFYEAEALIDRAKIREIEKKSHLTLKEGDGITSNNSISKKINNILSRENVIYAGRFVSEQPITIREASGKRTLSLITTEEIRKRIEKIPEKHRSKIGTIHIGTIQIIIKSTYLRGVRSPIKIILTDERIQTNEKIIGYVEGNLAFTTVKFDVSIQYGIPIRTPYINNSISIYFDFKRKDLMQKDDIPFTILYAVSYALSNSAYSIDFASRDLIHIDDLFMTSTKYRPIPRIVIEEEKEKEREEERMNSPSSSNTIPELGDVLRPRLRNKSDELAKINSQLSQILRRI